MFLIILLPQFCFVYSQWFSGEDKQQTTTSIDTENASKPIPATSPIQCILKCKRKWMNGFFVGERNECFCLKSEDQKIFSDENSDGIYIQEHEVTTFILLKH